MSTRRSVIGRAATLLAAAASSLSERCAQTAATVKA